MMKMNEINEINDYDKCEQDFVPSIGHSRVSSPLEEDDT